MFDLEQGWAWLEGNNTYYATASLEYKLYHSKSFSSFANVFGSNLE